MALLGVVPVYGQTLVPGETNTSLKLTFTDHFVFGEVNAYQVQIREELEEEWGTTCHLVDHGRTPRGDRTIPVFFQDLEPGTAYIVRYRNTNLGECGIDPEDPDPWSASVPGTTLVQPLPRIEFSDMFLAWATRISLNIDAVGPHIEVRKIPESELLNLTGLFFMKDYYDDIHWDDVLAPDEKVTDLTGLEHAINLERLYLGGHEIEDISALADLELTELNLQGNRIRDIGVLSGLTRLSKLYLGGNQIQNLTPVSRLTLTEFSAESNQIRDLSPLFRWTWTQISGKFDLSNNRIRDIGLLTNLAGSEVTELDLSQNQIVDINPLGSLGQSSLKDLNLSDNRIVDIEPLAQFADSELTYLYLTSNQISDVSPLRDLVQLAYLHLWGNPIEDKSPLYALVDANPDMYVDIDLVRVSVSTPAPLTEETLDGAVLTLTVKGGRFSRRIPDMDLKDILYITGINGVALDPDAIERVSPTEATVGITFNRSVRIEEDTRLLLTVRSRMLDGYFFGDLVVEVPVFTESSGTGTGLAADFNRDGEVGFSDFFLFVDAFGSDEGRYDLDGSGTVDFGDFFLFADSFGSSEN